MDDVARLRCFDDALGHDDAARVGVRREAVADVEALRQVLVHARIGEVFIRVVRHLACNKCVVLHVLFQIPVHEARLGTHAVDDERPHFLVILHFEDLLETRKHFDTVRDAELVIGFRAGEGVVDHMPVVYGFVRVHFDDRLVL